MSFEYLQPTLRSDWDRTGWNRYLPFEGEVLWHVFCDATQWGVDGDIDVLLDWQESMHPVLGPGCASGRDWLPEPGRRRPSRKEIARLLAETGEEYPTTLDQVAEVGLSLGLYRRRAATDGVRWRVPAALPLPTEVLPMTARQRRAEDRYRWLLGGAEIARDIAEYLVDDGEAAETVTSVGELSAELHCEPDTIRHGLEYLCAPPPGTGYLRVYLCQGRRRRAIDPERLRLDTPCVLVPHWRRLWKRFGMVWHLEGRGEYRLNPDAIQPLGHQ